MKLKWSEYCNKILGYHIDGDYYFGYDVTPFTMRDIVGHYHYHQECKFIIVNKEDYLKFLSVASSWNVFQSKLRSKLDR